LYTLTIQRSILSADIIKKKQEISELPIYKELAELEDKLREFDRLETEMKTNIKE
jgi:hypothetical protein